MAAALYSANKQSQSAEFIVNKKGEELILSVFTHSNDTNSTRRIYIYASVD